MWQWGFLRRPWRHAFTDSLCYRLMKTAPIRFATVSHVGLSVLAPLYRARRGWDALRGSAPEMKRGRSLFYRTIWSDAATALGATIVDLGDSLLEIRTESGTLRILEYYTSLDDLVTLRIAGNKPLVHRLLRERGLPVPSHCVCDFDDFKTASQFVGGSHSSFVVKPARSTAAGNGVTAGVRGARGLVRAMAFAGAYCGEVLIERQVEGDDYRLLYLDGELLDAVKRLPPGVDGDGSSSVLRLIATENERRRKQGFEASQTFIKTDWELRQTLKRQGLRLRSVPRAGEHVKLKSKINENNRAENKAATELVCASLVRAGSIAAATLGVRLAGVDVVTPDPLVPLEECGGAIIEVNTTPGLHFHYRSQGDSPPVARAILRHVIATSQPASHATGFRIGA